MTILQMVAVRDVKAEAFNFPAAVPSLGMALRSFTDEVNRRDDNNAMNRHPADFSLYHIGTYDTATGSLNPISPPTHLLDATQALASS
ncbi:nonstructural protein [Apis mellifera associated microvirus 1]|nr:nonstructural protein [Apis mellifera associated microvirus 1]